MDLTALDILEQELRPTVDFFLRMEAEVEKSDVTNYEEVVAEISAKIKGSTELMKQFYSNLCDVPELEDQRRVTMYMESTESRSPTRAFELNSLYLLHAVLYRHHAEIVSSSDNPLTGVLRDLGNMPDQLSADQNKQVE